MFSVELGASRCLSGVFAGATPLELRLNPIVTVMSGRQRCFTFLDETQDHVRYHNKRD